MSLKYRCIFSNKPFASCFVDLQAQVSSAERKNKRLKEVFAQKIQEFREACYSLTGYRIDVVQDQQYKLKSMYAERSSDCLLFQVSGISYKSDSHYPSFA
jgi:mitotic spindle assembly checkpoint protein MAD1